MTMENYNPVGLTNKANLLKAFEMLLDGATYAEVAEIFGCTRQNVHRKFSPIMRKNKDPRTVFPGLNRWLYTHRLTKAEFARLLSVPTSTMYYALDGRTEIRKDLIDKILAFTGLTYEEMTAEEEVSE